MTKKELNRMKKKHPILQYRQLNTLITFHLEALVVHANGYLENEVFEFQFDAACFHLNELQKIFKKESQNKIVQKLSIQE
jgi:hypothetical protein